MVTRQAPTRQQQPDVVVPDLLSFDSWGNETLAMSSTTASTSPSSSSMDDSTHVSISGVLFSLDPPTFDKLRELPWQTQGATSSLPTHKSNEPVDDEDSPVASYFLSTSPELFDILLHHVLFGTLPPSMAEHDMEELEIMALSLGLQSLAQHLQVSQPPPRCRHHRRRINKAAGFDHKVSAVRSWAAVKRWSSSTSSRILVKKAKNKKTKNQHHHHHHTRPSSSLSATHHHLA